MNKFFNFTCNLPLVEGLPVKSSTSTSSFSLSLLNSELHFEELDEKEASFLSLTGIVEEFSKKKIKHTKNKLCSNK